MRKVGTTALKATSLAVSYDKVANSKKAMTALDGKMGKMG